MSGAIPTLGAVLGVRGLNTPTTKGALWHLLLPRGVERDNSFSFIYKGLEGFRRGIFFSP